MRKRYRIKEGSIAYWVSVVGGAALLFTSCAIMYTFMYLLCV